MTEELGKGNFLEGPFDDSIGLKGGSGALDESNHFNRLGSRGWKRKLLRVASSEIYQKDALFGDVCLISASLLEDVRPPTLVSEHPDAPNKQYSHQNETRTISRLPLVIEIYARRPRHLTLEHCLSCHHRALQNIRLEFLDAPPKI